MRSSKASAENMVLKIVGNLDFKPSESAIDRATSYVEGLLKKSGDLFKIVSDPIRMDKVRAKVIEILIVGSMAKENPRGVYTTYSAWRAAAKKAGAVRFEGDKDIAQAFDANGRGVAEWDGAEGYIYRKSEMRNPMHREEPLYVKYLSLKSGEEPFMMQGTKYEYVWAEYPGGIKDIGVYSYANDLVYSYDSFRKMMNLDRTNPVHSRNPRHRIAVRLSKSRKRNPLESGANISDDEDINTKASNMG